MKQYRQLDDITIQLQPDGVCFPTNTCREHRKMLAEIEAGTAELLPVLPIEIHWVDKRQASIEDGGYGSIREQLEMLGEGDETALAKFQVHNRAVKARFPKP
jgi:hypothetical protein